MLDKKTREELKSIVSKLRSIGNGEYTPSTSHHGICVILENVDNWSTHAFLFKPIASPEKRLRKYFQSWDLFSGNCMYPVSSPVAHISEAVYYRNCKDKWEGKYGADRRKLCLHIADCLERDLEAM